MAEKLRTVVTTDGEIDDMNSFIRFLLYANDVDIAGIILTSSMFHYAGTENKPSYRWTGETWISELIDKYGQVYPNLKIHDANYPTPQSLLDVYHVGNISDVGDMAEETDGSNHLMKLLLDDDPRKLYIQTWGGTNTTARALKSIQERYENTDEWERIKLKIEEKVVLYIILDQDNTYKDYIEFNWNLTILTDNMNFGYFAYVWRLNANEIKQSLESTWFKKHIMNKGALLEQYALMGDGYYLEGEIDSEQFGQESYMKDHPEFKKYDFISEGDSPSYFYLLQTALRGFENPNFGGWGGRFVLSRNGKYVNRAYDYNPYHNRFEVEYTFSRWIPAIQADFAARAEWCIHNQFDETSHYPKLSMLSDQNVRAGQEVTLTVDAFDPNNFPLAYKWWCYEEASSYYDFSNMNMIEDKHSLGDMMFTVSIHSDRLENNWSLKMTDADTNKVSFTIPEDAKIGDTFHIILEVSNSCSTPLTTYRRIILTVE